MYITANPPKSSDELSPLSNREAWRQLGSERDGVTRVILGIGMVCLAAIASANTLLMLTSLPPWGAAATRLQKVSQIYRVMGRLLNKFESRGAIITPRLNVPDNGSLDLFIRFPDPPKANFAIGLRSNGRSTVSYSETREKLYRRNRRGGLKPWEVDLFQRIGLQEFWLRKNRQSLFGQSSKDKNRPVVKILVLTGETRLADHPEHLYALIGDQKVLLIQKRVAVYVMEEKQLIPFIEAWLAKLNNPNNG